MDERYRAFISYSHAADSGLASALQRGLQRLGQPWWRRSTFKVFRDQTSLAASPALWPEIVRHLERSDYLVLMASPQAAASPWVDKEVKWWLQNRSPERLLIVATGGDIAWDAASGDFDWQRSTCLPQALRGHFHVEPLYVDLRRVHAAPFSASDPRFRDGLLTLGAALHGRPKDELDSEDLREYRRRRQAAIAVVVAFGILGPVALYGLWQARQQSALALQQWREAESRRLAADATDRAASGESPHDAISIALMAWRLAPTDEARRALATIERTSSGMARILGRHTRGMAALAFSDDGTRFATRGKEGAAIVWNTADWTQEGGLLTGARSNDADCGGSSISCNVPALTFNRTGSHLLAWDRAGAITFWDLRARSLKTFSEFEQPGTVLRSAAIRTDGNQVAIGGDNGLLAVWEPASAQLRRAPGSLAGWDVTGIHFMPDGRVLALAAKHYSGVRLAAWHPATGQFTLGSAVLLPSRDGYRYAEVASFSQSGTRVLLLGHSGSALAEVEPNARLRDLTATTPDFRVEEATLAMDGRVVFAEGGAGWQRWDFGGPVPAVVAKGTRARPWIRLTWSADGRWRAERDKDDVRVWDASSAVAAGPAKTIEGSCGLDGHATGCIRQLCAKVLPALDEARLRKLFGIRDYQVMYERYRDVTGASLCD